MWRFEMHTDEAERQLVFLLSLFFCWEKFNTNPHQLSFRGKEISLKTVNSRCFPHTRCCSRTGWGAGSQVDGGVRRRRYLHLPQGGGSDGHGAGLGPSLTGVLAGWLGASGRARLLLLLLAGGGLRGVVLIVQLEAKEAESELLRQLIEGAGSCDRPKAAILSKVQKAPTKGTLGRHIRDWTPSSRLFRLWLSLRKRSHTVCTCLRLRALSRNHYVWLHNFTPYCRF